MKGEVSFEHDGARYVLKLDVNAICTLEEYLGVAVQSLGAAASQKMTTVRAVFWAGLTGAHPEMTITKAGEIMSDIGAPQAVELVGKALTAAFPEAKKAAAQPATARPQ